MTDQLDFEVTCVSNFKKGLWLDIILNLLFLLFFFLDSICYRCYGDIIKIDCKGRDRGATDGWCTLYETELMGVDAKNHWRLLLFSEVELWMLA